MLDQELLVWQMRALTPMGANFLYAPLRSLSVACQHFYCQMGKFFIPHAYRG